MSPEDNPDLQATGLSLPNRLLFSHRRSRLLPGSVPSFTDGNISIAAPGGAASTSKGLLPQTDSLANFRRGRTAAHQSRWAIKGNMIKALLALGEDAPTAHMLKNLRGCGCALRGTDRDQKQGGLPKRQSVEAIRTAGLNGLDQSGWAKGIMRCGKRLCPVCGLRIAVRRIAVLQERAKAVAENYPTALHVTGAITCRHHDGNDPRQKYDALSALFDEWKKQDWVGGRKSKGLVVITKTLLGYFMCPEDTFGLNGHHPHLQFGASLQLSTDLDTKERIAEFEAFRLRSQKWFERKAPKFGITCEWKENWMVMAKSPIEAVIRYTVKTEKEAAMEDLENQGLTPGQALSKLWGEKEVAMSNIKNDLEGLTREATLGQLKLDRAGASFFDMPIFEQLKLWNSTRGMRWFRVGGIWKDANTEKPDEALAEENESQGVTVAEITPPVWTYLASEIQHILLALVEDVRYPRACVRNVWEAAQAMAFDRIDQRTIRDTLVSMLPDLRGVPPAKGP